VVEMNLMDLSKKSRIVVAIHKDLDGLASLAIFLRYLKENKVIRNFDANRVEVHYLDEYQAIHTKKSYDLSMDLPITSKSSRYIGIII
jgi:oligoribonuclease NrnB/cAMP/cGMP phosphodiesterase (DHH superfamily)